MQPKNMMMNLSRRIIPRRFSTGSKVTTSSHTNIDTSENTINTSSTISTISSSAIAKSTKSLLSDNINNNNNNNGNGNSIGYNNHGPVPSQNQQRENFGSSRSRSNKKKKSYRSRRRNRRHTMDNQIADESTASIVSSPPTVTPTKPPKTASNANVHDIAKKKKKHKRRSSFANAASTVLATSRNWLSVSVTNNNNNNNNNNNSKNNCSSNSNMITASSSSPNSPTQNQNQNEDCNNDIASDRNSDSVHDCCCSYASEQTQLQSLAREMHREGMIGRAIECWEQSLELAETKHRAAASTCTCTSCLCSGVTEILCMLVDLHFQQYNNKRKRLQVQVQVQPGAKAEQDERSKVSTQSCDTDSSSSISSSSSLCSLSLEEALLMQPLQLQQAQEKQKHQKCQQSSSSSSDDGTSTGVAPYHHHKRKAQQYVHRIKSVMVQPTWLGCDLSLMEFLCEAEAWELALIVANKHNLSEEESRVEGQETEKESSSDESSGATIIVGAQKLATLHFHIASLKLDSHKQGEAIHHLQATMQCLQQVIVSPVDDELELEHEHEHRDNNMTMYLQVLQLLAAEYQQQGHSMLALKAYEEQRNHSPSEQYAHISCQMAEIYISDGRLDMALGELESAHDQHITYNKSKYDNNGDDDDDDSSTDSRNSNSTMLHNIRLQLLQTKGDVYCRLGRMDESMEVYRQALQEAHNPAEKAKLLYIMGRLCIRMGRTRDAISCFMCELEITERELGAHHLSVSVIYHELAKLYDEGLGLHKMGRQKYQKALQIELAVMDDLHSTVASCNKCCDNAVAVLSHHRTMCDTHANIHAQVQGQIRETKKCMGRIHFKLGDFDGALKASLGGNDYGNQQH